MTRVRKVINNIQSHIQNKIILEVACGRADFSIEASKISKSVFCIDLDDFRLSEKINERVNVTFEQMNATSMSYDDESFDTVIMYNAIAHLDRIIDDVLSECLRVLKFGGTIFVISSFSIDKTAIDKKLLPALLNSGLKFKASTDKVFTYVQIEK